MAGPTVPRGVDPDRGEPGLAAARRQPAPAARRDQPGAQLAAAARARWCSTRPRPRASGWCPTRPPGSAPPRVHVSFGPLAEVAPDLPVAAGGWAPDELAEACRALLADPDLYQAQITAVLRAAETYTWDRTAELLVSRLPPGAVPAAPMTHPIPGRQSMSENATWLPPTTQAGVARGARVLRSPRPSTASRWPRRCKDFEVANARVLDLTHRLTELNQELLELRSDHERLRIEHNKVLARPRGTRGRRPRSPPRRRCASPRAVKRQLR